LTSYHRIIPVFLALTIAFTALGCSSRMKNRELTLDAHYYFDRGMEEMKKKDYPKAVEDFQTVVESFSGSEIVDEALFNLAEAHFKNEDYLTSAYEFERVYADYPSSPYAPEAQYKKALSLFMESPKASLDQDNTEKAIREFNLFVENYPDNKLIADAQGKLEELKEKLAYKDYLAAELYYKMKYYDAAIISFQTLIKEYPRSSWVDDSEYGIGLAHMKKKEYDKAATVFNQLMAGEKTDPGIKKKATKQLAEVKKRGAKK
jgi:outer membrane protein assembly factor BamD